MKKTMLLWGMLGFFSGIAAQSLRADFVHYGPEQGLSHEEVSCILQDQRGLLWFGTSVGLNRFDGRHFKVFLPLPGDTASLPGERITGLSQDTEGRIWVSTDRGLCWYEWQEGVFHRISTADPEHTALLRNATVSRVVFDRKGYGWLMAGNSLVRLDLSDFDFTTEVFPLPEGVSGPGQLKVDRHGKVWLTAALNTWRFDPDTGAYRLFLGRRAADPALHFDGGSFYEEKDGTFWIGSWGAGLWRYDASRDSLVDFPDGPAVTTCFLRDTLREGAEVFWVGGGDDGLYLLTLPDLKIVRQRHNPLDPFSHNGKMVRDIFRDPQTGIVWLATDKGIEKHDPYQIRFSREVIPVTPGNQFFDISAFLQDEFNPGTYWISIWGGGLVRWEREQNQFQHFLPPVGRFSREVFDLLQDRRGRLWMGVHGGVLTFDVELNRWRLMADFLHTPKINHKVLALLEDRKGNIWIGSNYEGLFCYDTAREIIAEIPFCDSLAHAQGAGRITNLYEDQSGQIWITTFNGVYRYQPATGQTHRIDLAHLPHYASDDLCAGQGETMWLATRNGLFHVDLEGRLLTSYDTKHGFPSDQVYRVRRDRNGDLWTGTNRGLYRLRLSDGQLLHFDRRDGLVASIISGGFELMPDGEIFFGTGKSFNYFSPEKVPLNTLAPKVVLNSIQVMNRERRLPEGQYLKLRPGENVVSFEFAALNYSQSEKNRYAYRLEGFDEAWTFTNQPVATYTNLDGGDYTLEVRGANNDGIWSENPLCIPLRIIPPFYQTWYFPVLLILSVLIAGALLAAYRRSQRQALELIRNRIARDLHDDMGSTLSSIRFFSEYARSKVAGQEEVDSVLQRISSSAASLSESMQDIIWTINTRHDQLEDLLTRMRSFGNRMLEARQIDFVVKVSDGFLPARLDISQRRNIYLIFKEAINNAIKYSDCSRVTLFLSIRRGHLKMIVEDNGKGFDPNHADQGNGLENMQQRAAEIGGTLQLRSCPGKGTCVELTARLGKKGKWG